MIEPEYLRLRQLAYADTWRAIKDGRLAHPRTHRCADCRRQASDYDHRDYRKRLDVEPVCREHNLKRGPAEPLWLRWKVPPATVRVRLLKEVEKFLRRHKVFASALGLAALNDPAFVLNLRRGSHPSGRTMDKVRAYMRKIRVLS